MRKVRNVGVLATSFILLFHIGCSEPEEPHRNCPGEIEDELDASTVFHPDASADAEVANDAGDDEDEVIDEDVIDPVDTCPAIDPVLQGSVVPYTSPYIAPMYGNPSSGGWANPGDSGFHPAQGTPWRYWTFEKTPMTAGRVDSADLRSWEFVAPANARIWMNEGDVSSGQHAYSISECPGQFAESVLPGDNKGYCHGGNGLVWATGDRQSPHTCNLEAGKTYYLNIAPFAIGHYQNCMSDSSLPECYEQVDGADVFSPFRNSFECSPICSVQMRAVPQ